MPNIKKYGKFQYVQFKDFEHIIGTDIIKNNIIVRIIVCARNTEQEALHVFNEEIEKLIMLNAPTEWLRLQEDIANADVDTKMRDTRKLTGNAKVFTLDELDQLRQELSAKAKEVNGNERAAHTVVELMDSLKVLTTENPQLVTGFVELLEELKKVGG